MIRALEVPARSVSDSFGSSALEPTLTVAVALAEAVENTPSSAVAQPSASTVSDVAALRIESSPTIAAA